ncbi:hypothetical protein [Caballeronia sp. LZ001]|nr:hypothetical protein [Caballeronia sp. LZ001]MDR5804810.1 hypothetical protein [Caballeronia sp. LZ001]
MSTEAVLGRNIRLSMDAKKPGATTSLSKGVAKHQVQLGLFEGL